MTVSLQMNSQHTCIECWFWGEIYSNYTHIIQIYNLLMKITQPSSMTVSLQMNSQHTCIECWFWGEIYSNYTHIIQIYIS